jgi:hypothetical protein
MPCLPYGNYYYNNQAEIDSFQFNYPGCKELEGDVHIGGDISNLNGLNVITSIGGDVLISGGLTSLTGLEGLTSIRGDLQFVNNHALTSMAGLEGLIFIEGSLFIGRKYHGGNDALISLTGLSGLTAIGEYLCIYDNDSLATLTGIEGLTSIGGSFHISENNALISMTGLQGLTSIGGFLEIWPNRSLNSLTGLQGLTSIGSYFSIWGPNDLTNLTGLENLTSIGGHIDISFNDALTSLEGLESLTSIGGYISITGNALTSLTGMDNIDAASITGISIDWNWTLSKCDIESICEYLANPNGSINIKDNATGCDSPEEVQDSCEANAVSIKERYIINNCMSSPNPCNGETTFFLSLDEPTHFKLVIMDRLGRVVATVMNKSLAIGTHRIKWNASGLSSGIYFYRLITGNQSSTGKLVVVR